MTPEEKVLAEIKEKISDLFTKIAELKIAEDERRAFNNEKAQYQVLIDDYKKHKQALIDRETRLDNGGVLWPK